MDPVSKSKRESPWLKQHQWPKGTSGNPKGRPIKRPITEIYEEILNDGATREAIKQQIISTMTSRGMAGVLERREMAERTEGKVSQLVEMEVSGKITLEQVLAAEHRANGDNDESGIAADATGEELQDGSTEIR